MLFDWMRASATPCIPSKYSYVFPSASKVGEASVAVHRTTGPWMGSVSASSVGRKRRISAGPTT